MTSSARSLLLVLVQARSLDAGGVDLFLADRLGDVLLLGDRLGGQADFLHPNDLLVHAHLILHQRNLDGVLPDRRAIGGVARLQRLPDDPDLIVGHGDGDGLLLGDHILADPRAAGLDLLGAGEAVRRQFDGQGRGGGVRFHRPAVLIAFWEGIVMKLGRKSAVVAVFAAAAVAFGAGTAEAAQSNSISGSSTPTWYTSTSLRHVTTSDDTMKVGLHHFPSGMQWRLINAHNSQVFAGPKAITTTNWVVVATHVNSGTVFYNSYKSSVSGNFDGNEYY